MYFGINIKKNKKFDVNDVCARLFICPRISPEHATRMLDMLVNGKLSIESFIDRTDTYIEELSRQKEIGDDIPYIMKTNWLHGRELIKPLHRKITSILRRHLAFQKRICLVPQRLKQQKTQ